MKILGLGASGYKGLRDDFYIDFLTKAKVSSIDKEEEVMEVAEGLYMPTNIVFTGSNSSGKTTILSLITYIYSLINDGRIKYNEYDFNGDKIDIETTFFLNNYLYKYYGTINKPINDFSDSKDSFCDISNEVILKRKYWNSYGKKNLTMPFTEVTDFEKSISDTSILFNLTKGKAQAICINNHFDGGKFDYSMYSLEVIFDTMERTKLSNLTRQNIIQVFDNTIFDIVKNKDIGNFTVTMCDKTVKIMSDTCLSYYLSDGTKKGMVLLTIATLVLKAGGILLIDEIENSFHKNLVENLIFLFADKRINKKQSILFFSTHYSEVLDIFNRRDNIYVMKNENGIYSKNLHTNYDYRGELSKSRLFNSNAYGTLLNYEQFMKLKKGLIHEISNNA